jgi:hypothetical protein
MEGGKRMTCVGQIGINLTMFVCVQVAESTPTEGLRIWRIEKFNVVKWPKEEYGSFFQGGTFWRS